MAGVEYLQAFYTRCTAPYSVSGNEGFGWRYVDAGVPLELLTAVESCLPVTSFVDRESFCRKVFMELEGYKILVNSVSVDDSPRGGNFFAHILFIEDDRFTALDAVCSLTDNYLWVEKDVCTKDWIPAQGNKLPFYHHNKQDIYTHLYQYLNREALTCDADDENRVLIDDQKALLFLLPALMAFEYLLETQCQSTILIIGCNRVVLNYVIQLIVLSLPGRFASCISYVTPANGYNFSAAKPPLIVGWIGTSDSEKCVTECIELLGLQDDAVFDLANTECHLQTQYACCINSLWRRSDDISNMERFIDWIDAYFYDDPKGWDDQRVLAASQLIGFDANGTYLNSVSDNVYGYYKKMLGIKEPAVELMITLFKYVDDIIDEPLLDKLTNEKLFYRDFIEVINQSKSEQAHVILGCRDNFFTFLQDKKNKQLMNSVLINYLDQRKW